MQPWQSKVSNDKLTEAINAGETSKRTRKLLPAELHQKARIKLAVLGAATSLEDLRELRGNRFEALREIAPGSSALESTTNTESALSGVGTTLTTWKLLIIIEEKNELFNAYSSGTCFAGRA